MTEHLEPLGLDDVLAIVERRRLRRQRMALRSALGAGAVLAVGAGVRAASNEDAAPTTTTPAADAPTSSTTPPPTTTVVTVEWQQAAIDRFYDLGFTFTDAERLAALWDTDPYVPKITAGLAPGAEVLRDADEDAAVLWFASLLDEYWAEGGTFEQAEALAASWGFEVLDAKAISGARHLADG